GAEARGALVVVERARLLSHRHGLRRQGAIPRALSRQTQPADRRRGAAGGHGRPYAGLSARGGQARARTLGHGGYSGAELAPYPSYPPVDLPWDFRSLDKLKDWLPIPREQRGRADYRKSSGDDHPRGGSLSSRRDGQTARHQ